MKYVTSVSKAATNGIAKNKTNSRKTHTVFKQVSKPDHFPHLPLVTQTDGILKGSEGSESATNYSTAYAIMRNQPIIAYILSMYIKLG